MTMLFKDEKIPKMPGQTCKLVTKALPGSFVSLLGVDQSVTFLGHGNDIDEARVAAETVLYDSATYVQGYGDGGKYSDFVESNAFIITNAVTGERDCSFGNRIFIDNGPLIYDDSMPEGFHDDDDESFPSRTEVRKFVPETWIFKDFQMGDKGKNLITTSVPDTITSFIVSGFAVHPEHGLQIATPRKITVFKEFFVKLYLPYSVRLGEVLKVDVSVFNYVTGGQKMVNAKVTLTGQNEFEFVDANMDICSFTTAAEQNSHTKTIEVTRDNGAATYFLIRAKKVGALQILVKATGPSNIEDTIERYVKVEREGYRETENKAIIVDLRNQSSYSLNFKISFPSEHIGDSIQISSSVIGDLLGPALVNIHSLM